MSLRLGQAACAALLLCLTAPVSADAFQEARGWLERMASAMQELDYQGTFVYVRGADMETVRLTHARIDGKMHERMVAVSGPRREIMRDEQGVRAIVGDPEQPLQDPLFTGAVFPDFSVAALEEARDRYLFEVGASGRIAGHNGRKISIIPRDEYRYGYELWLEQGSALLLRWVLYDPQRRPLAKLMFTDLVTGSAVDYSALASANPPQQFIAVQHAAPTLDLAAGSKSAALAPEGMPPGFRLVAHARVEASEGFEHLVFSDGLASVSVYLEQASEPGGIAPGLSRMGTTNAWSRSEDSRRVTAIGEVPPLTLKTIGQAFLAHGAP